MEKMMVKPTTASEKSVNNHIRQGYITHTVRCNTSNTMLFSRSFQNHQLFICFHFGAIIAASSDNWYIKSHCYIAFRLQSYEKLFN